MGFRMGFDIWANTKSGAAHLFRFSVHHSITSALTRYLATSPASAIGETFANLTVWRPEMLSFRAAG